jgi:hypothetical protein
MQSNFYVVPDSGEALNDLKVRVGRGNNSRLLKDCMRNRWWW